MKKEKVAILSLAVDDGRYIAQQERLNESIKKHLPECKVFNWTNSYPEGSSSHKESPYGFKVHAVNEARKQGFKKIIWVDTACIFVNGEIEYWFGLVKKYGVLAQADDNNLSKFVDPKCYKWFKKTEEQSLKDDERLVGGSLYVFDFEVPLCVSVFAAWEAAEKHGQFAGSRKHRHDETCMALALYMMGSQPQHSMRYNCENNPIIIKKHFK